MIAKLLFKLFKNIYMKHLDKIVDRYFFMDNEISTLFFKENYLAQDRIPYTREYKSKISNTIQGLVDLYNKSEEDQKVIGDAIDILDLFEDEIQDTIWQREDVNKLENSFY